MPPFCPKCGAGPNNSCINKKGEIRKPHKVRKIVSEPPVLTTIGDLYIEAVGLLREHQKAHGRAEDHPEPPLWVHGAINEKELAAHRWRIRRDAILGHTITEAEIK